MRILSWNEFDLCIAKISQRCIKRELSGVYGFPRGGLCLAVALSHSLNIPLLKEPQPGSLVVDDVYETGITLRSVKEIPDITVYVWLSKSNPDWWNAIEITDQKEWLIFPWENQQVAEKDHSRYHYSRYS